MYDSKRIVGIAGRVAATFLGRIFAAMLPGGGFAATQNAAKPSTSEEASPKQIQDLMTLVGDPKLRCPQLALSGTEGLFVDRSAV